jgi:hypothetical protein
MMDPLQSHNCFSKKKMVAKRKKKDTSVRKSMGRLDDAAHAVILVLWSLLDLCGRHLWKIGAIAKKVNCDWFTVKRAVTDRTPPSLRKKRVPPRLPTASKAAITLRRRRVQYLASLKVTKVGPPPEHYVYSKKQYPSSTTIAKELKIRHGTLGANGEPTVSRSTVLRDARAVGLKSKKRSKGPMRKQMDEGHRLAFCRAKLRKPKRVLATLAFSDEKWCNTNDHGLPYEFCTPEEQASRRVYDRYAKSVHIWGCIGIGLKRLIVLPKGSITAATYIHDSLTPSLPDFNGRLFMQDGARPHTAKKTLKFLQTNNVDYIADWPARSPDLNPIETLWALLARRVGNRLPTDEAELEQFFVEEWNAVPQSAIDVLVKSFAARCTECVRLNGATINTKLGSKKRSL